MGTHFEKEMKKLEETMQKMERGQLSLDEMLKTFEEGVKAYQACKSALANAESKIEMISQELVEE